MTAITTHESIELICGDTWSINGTIKDENGIPMSLVGVSVNWKLDTMDSTINLLNLTISSGTGVEIVDAASGEILITVTPDTSTTIKPGLYYDWLRITMPDGSVSTEWNGPINVLKEPKGT